MVFDQRMHREGRVAASQAPAPFPTRQLFILSLCRICEPIAFMSIFPYVYYMISSFKITKDERQIAIYAGMVTSAFAFAEFSSGVVWGKLSDKIGRKPVLITGLAGTGLSMLIFGLAPSLPVALLARALGGLLNGNIGVLQTTVAEMITVKEHQPRAYTVMPFVWSLGSFLGPALGGALAQPCDSYPSLFRRGTIFDRFPFLLPNLVCTVILGVGVLIGILFLEETHEEKKLQRDVGLELGQWILDKILRRKRNAIEDISPKGEDANLDDCRSLLRDDDEPPGYRTTEGSPRIPSTRVQSPVPQQRLLDTNTGNNNFKDCATGKAFTKPVVLTIIAYGILAYHTISFEQLMPILLSMPSSHQDPSLPFKFVGGFALTPKSIGFILSLQGIYAMLAQLFLVPPTLRRFGSLGTFRFVALIYPVLYAAVPYMVLLPEKFQMTSIYFCLIWKVTAHALAYPANAILLTNAAPSKKILGTINGFAAATASLCRAFGPTLSGLIHSVGLEKGYSGLAWWVCALFCIAGAVETCWMNDASAAVEPKNELDEEAEMREPLVDPMIIDAAIVAASVEDAEQALDQHFSDKFPN